MVKVQEVSVICGASFFQSPGTLQTKGKGSVGTANVLVAGSIPLVCMSTTTTVHFAAYLQTQIRFFTPCMMYMTLYMHMRAAASSTAIIHISGWD